MTERSTKRAKTSRQRQREIGNRDGDPGLRKRQYEIEIRHKKEKQEAQETEADTSQEG